MGILNRETQFNIINCKVYRKVREANHRSISYQSEYKLAKPLRVGKKPFGKLYFSVREITKIVRFPRWRVHCDYTNFEG